MKIYKKIVKEESVGVAAIAGPTNKTGVDVAGTTPNTVGVNMRKKKTPIMFKVRRHKKNVIN